MKTKDVLLEEIKDKLLENTGITIFYSDSKREKNKNSVAKIKEEYFVVVVKPEITQGNKGIVLQQLKDASREENLPVLLITKYIPSVITKSFVEEGINYMDAAGNCNIQHNSIVLIVDGKKTERLPKTNQPRAFQEAGIKLIYCLLVNPDNINKSFRELSELSQISLGSVSTIVQELVDSKFLLKTQNKSGLDLSSVSEKSLWGGECAASIMTKNLTPSNFTIYTNTTWQSLGKSLKLIPDENGKIEILRLFYDTEEGNTVSPLLTYADLMGSGDSRNIETAEIILNNELQYLK